MKLIITLQCNHRVTFKSHNLITSLRNARSLNCKKCGCNKPVKEAEVR